MAHGEPLSTRVGSVVLRAPVMTASGTAGHGAELAAYGALAELGAVVVKSLAAFAWPGNPGPRVHGLPGGSMLNSVGLQGPGVESWRAHDLPRLAASGATVVASIWGHSPEEYAAAAGALVGAPEVTALEVNVSCPNLEGHLLAGSPSATAEAVEAAAAAGLPRWAKLSPNVPDIVELAAAALDAGAEALTLVNTLFGMRLGTGEERTPLSGGLSGPALHPVAVRAVFECRRAFPGAGIVGVGGVASGADALELLMAGADAVQVGTATFADPRAPWKIQDELAAWCSHHATTVREVVGAALR
ncbi:MAG: dihydroorotate dehydrogenase [Acidimicrobiales bacterium]